MGDLMTEDFEHAHIDGAFVRELALLPSNNVRMSLLRAPLEENGRQVSTLSELQFHEIQGFHCNFDANPWLEIKSHAIVSHSEYLKRYLEGSHESTPAAELHHFKIICDEGEISVLARRFTFVVVEEIPHHGLSKE